MDYVPLMKKLRMRRGARYVLFIQPDNGFSEREAYELSEFLHRQGFDVSVVIGPDVDKIKVAEQL